MCGVIHFFSGEAPLPAIICRHFVCRNCNLATVICRACYRGHRYCSIECSKAGRAFSQKRAGQRFARTSAGRHGNARRQAAFRNRARCKKKNPQIVTHHPSSPLRPVRKLLSRLIRPLRRRFFEQDCCFVCGSQCVTGIFKREKSNVEENYTP